MCLAENCDSDAADVRQAIELMSSVAEWTDQLVELQLWVRLSYSALTAADHASVTRCTDQALQFSFPDDPKHPSVSRLITVVVVLLLLFFYTLSAKDTKG